ncbi:hypothetical protein GCM10023321_78440 [Pseudonocardia eucalypti]|uniref:Secreted protein n=2 Tax=Pseudonocardia eucalypti TaxID=648755 RepID=A0ABP9RBK9_9PSEU
MPRLFAKKLAAATFMTAVAGGAMVVGPGSAIAAEPLATGAASSLAPADDRHRHRHCDSDEIREIRKKYAHDHERRRVLLRERGCSD